MKEKIQFFKMHGGGNDFILIDGRELKAPFENEVIRRLCDRHMGIGADGLMILGESDRADFRIDYFNADGYAAGMCGNGARCAVMLMYKVFDAPRQCTFEIQGEIYEAEVKTNEMVQLKMQPFQILHRPEELQALCTEGIQKMLWVDSGVPHLVVEITSSLDDLDVNAMGAALRYHPMFEPQGTNVNFISVKEEGWLRVRVYERGVEKETLSCGTGAVACAVYASLQFGWESPIMVESPGGALVVVFDRDWQSIYLLGPVELVFVGVVFPEFFKSKKEKR
ncbi:MAG: diaminopimelate epimerase [Calditrichaeota bacterium]|nr:MAG: diaminopimelate epimerase [Calditrichota bacterium]